MRYGKDGHFSISSSNEVMVMHPIKPELDGKKVSDFKDPEGNLVFVLILGALSAYSNRSMLQAIGGNPEVRPGRRPQEAEGQAGSIKCGRMGSFSRYPRLIAPPAVVVDILVERKDFASLSGCILGGDRKRQAHMMFLSSPP